MTLSANAKGIIRAGMALSAFLAVATMLTPAQPTGLEPESQACQTFVGPGYVDCAPK